MAAIINTNIASLNLQKSLSSSQTQLNKAMERLSSGLRINNASDDAAGLARATSLDSQVRGMQVASRNINDAISFSQVQESALGSQVEALQRMRELAVQAKNGSVSSADRTNLDKEYQALAKEVGRIGNSQFNGTAIFGSAISYQIGANASDVIATASVSSVSSDATNGNFALTSSGAATAALALTTFAASQTVFALADTTYAAISGTPNAAANSTYSAAQTTYAAALAAYSQGLESIVAGNTYTAGGSNATSIAGNDTTAATTALGFIDGSLSKINSDRSNLGALTSRLNSIVSGLTTNIVNSTSAKSRIMDADYAQETSNLTRGQILQQAGTAMLTQANSMPNIVLSLLKG